jgi:hypothetical protein
MEIQLDTGGSCLNPSYSGGKDQEDHCSKAAQAKSSGDPILKKPITKIGLVETLRSNPNTAKIDK